MVYPPDYQKPIAGFFKGINKRQPPKDYIVHPEFVSEVLRLQHIKELASNPLKYGWAG